jgi:hypothetical protein
VLGCTADLGQAGQLLPQLVEGDELLGRHLLIPGALAVCLCELVEPGLLFHLGRAPLGGAVHLDHRVYASPQPLGVTQKVPDFLPDLLLELLGAVMRVQASVQYRRPSGGL